MTRKSSSSPSRPSGVRRSLGLFPYCKLRQRPDGSIRPRFEPGPRERALGFKAKDLKRDDGSWFSLDEVAAFARDTMQEIASVRAGEKDAPGRRPGRMRQQEARRTGGPTGNAKSVAALLAAYLASADFEQLRDRTRRDYRVKADAILHVAPTRGEERRSRDKDEKMPTLFSRAPVTAIGKPEVKAFFETLEAARGLATARSAIAVLSAAWSWGTLSPDWRLGDNPCLRLKLRRPAPRLVIWTPDEVRALVAAADAAGVPSIGDAMMLALFSGQRQGDILALVDRGSLAADLDDDKPIRLVQSKRGARVAVFAAPPLVARLKRAEERRRGRPVPPIGDVPVCLCEATGAAWNEHTFRHVFAGLREAAAQEARNAGGATGIADKKFLDLRDTAVTWLANAGATLPEIAAVTGHSLASIHSIMKHYLELGEPLAREAARKLTAWLDAEGMKL